MKKNMILCSIIAAMMIIIPLMSVNYVREPQEKTSAAASTQADDEDDGTIKVMLSANGFVKSIQEKEYVIGAVAGEMDTDYNEEALKAQAVVCYTYAQYIKSKNSQSKKTELNGADISDDSASYQSYIDKSKRKEKWGSSYDKNEKKIEKAVNAVFGKTITYEGQPILAAYFDSCAGKTESAKNVWGSDIKYLQSVESAGDKLSPSLSKKYTFSSNEIEKKLSDINGISFEGKKSEWFKNIKKAQSGIVLSLKAGNVNVKGSEIRTKLNLRSSNFSVKYEDGKFLFTVNGNGHFVGMSQYGADYMARQGSSWKDIINHYYKNIKIE